MPSEPIPFDATQASGLEQLAGASPAMVNGLVAADGTVRQRPGISAWSGFPSTIPNANDVIGMIPFGSNLVYVTDDRQLQSLAAGVAASLSTVSALTMLDGAERPSMIAMRDKIVMAGGGAIQKWAGSGVSTRLGGSPPRATHVAAVANRIVAKIADEFGRVQWSGPGEVYQEIWDDLDITEAEARPDPLVALHDNTNELFAFGSRTLQVYQPDEQIGFATGRAVNVGLLAAHSVVLRDQEFMFLDTARRFVATDGRPFSESDVLSTAIDSTLRDMATVSDAWGFHLKLAPWDVCTWMFPSLGKGLIYQPRAKRWSEWRGWSNGNWRAPGITSFVYWPEENLALVGFSTGRIARVDATAYTDLDDPIKVELRTGFINRDTEAHKHSESVQFVFRRGQATSAAPVVRVSWRDDLGAFCDPVTLSLGVAGDYIVTQPVRSLGAYRRRQWRLEFTDNAEFVFVTAVETFTVGSNH